MKFLQLEILNLASLDKQGGEVINFEEGALGESTIFSIVGPTGSGKSTLLDAICLALYNRAPRYPRKKGDKNQSIEIFGATDASESNRLAPTDSRNILTRGKKRGLQQTHLPCQQRQHLPRRMARQIPESALRERQDCAL